MSEVIDINSALADLTKNKLPIQAIPVYDVDFYDIATNTNIVKNNVFIKSFVFLTIQFVLLLEKYQ